MKKELIIKKCQTCLAKVRILKDCNCNNCGITCCNKPMVEEVTNSTEASVEKHLPVFKVIDNKIYVVINHVMEEEHYIEWIMYVTDEKEELVYIKDKAEVTFDYIAKGSIYSYCNKHGLWKIDID